MPDEQGRMFGREVAERMGIRPSDWRARVSRGFAPKPDGTVTIKNVSHSFWLASTIDRYLAARARRSSNGKAATVTAPNPGTHDGPGVDCRRCSSEGFDGVHHDLCACGRALPHPPIGGLIKPCQGQGATNTGSNRSGGDPHA